MNERAVKLHPGRRKKHGGYTFLSKGKLPGGRRDVERYLTAVRMGLVQDLGPTGKDLTTAQLVLIDRIVTKLGVVRCIEEYIREGTVFEGKRLAPSLRESYLAYNNSIRLDLAALGIDKKKSDQVLDLGTYLEEKAQAQGNENDSNERSVTGEGGMP